MTTISKTSDKARWLAFRDSRNTGLSEPYGWLAPVALHWLSDEPERFEGLPGTWHLVDGKVQLDLADGEVLRQEEIDLPRQVSLDPDYTRMRHGSLEIEIIFRSGLAALRVRDPDAPLRRRFSGVPVFDFDPDWIIQGEYIEDATLGIVTLGSVAEGISHNRAVSGRVRFNRDGVTAELTVTHASAGPQLLFRDSTSGVETYAALRNLDLTLPERGGEILLDFNRTVNLPCAFTDFCTCPLPPPTNILPFAVRAGEKSLKPL